MPSPEHTLKADTAGIIAQAAASSARAPVRKHMACEPKNAARPAHGHFFFDKLQENFEVLRVNAPGTAS
jgi:hypothetical protein